MSSQSPDPDTLAGAPSEPAPRPAKPRRAESAAFDAPLPKTKPRAKPRRARQAKAAAAQAAAPADGAMVTKKELLARVKARADGVKGADLRIAMDAVLAELGNALVAGEGLKLPGFGVLKVQRRKELPTGDMVVVKLRRKKPGAGPKDPLAKPAEGR